MVVKFDLSSNTHLQTSTTCPTAEFGLSRILISKKVRLQVSELGELFASKAIGTEGNCSLNATELPLSPHNFKRSKLQIHQFNLAFHRS